MLGSEGTTDSEPPTLWPTLRGAQCGISVRARSPTDTKKSPEPWALRAISLIGGGRAQTPGSGPKLRYTPPRMRQLARHLLVLALLVCPLFAQAEDLNDRVSRLEKLLNKELARGEKRDDRIRELEEALKKSTEALAHLPPLRSRTMRCQ